MTKKELLDKLTDLGWDYQSMTRSGQQTYDEIMQGIGAVSYTHLTLPTKA